jgi:hypothetical protein
LARIRLIKYRVSKVLRQVPAIVASVVLGLGVAQVGDAPRGPDRTHRAAQDNQQKTVAPAPSQTSGGRASIAQGAEGGRPYHDLRGPPRTARRWEWDHRWANQWAISGDHGGLYGGDGLVYWAPGRWYRYPGFGDKRYFMPQPEGVWGR